MSPDLHLLIHNIGFGISGAVSLGLAFFLFFHKPRSTPTITLALTLLSVATFIFSHMAGVSIADPYLSRRILTLNVSVIFIAMFNTHCVLAVLNKIKERRLALIAVYLSGIGLSLIYLLLPETFLDLSQPKMYFPNYYVPGPHHWAFRVLFNIIVPLYFMGELLLAYRASRSRVERNRYLYFVAAFVLGWGVGFTPIYLVYDIPIDPAFGSPFIFLFSLPFLYALLKYELMDIRIIAKKAFLYAVAILGVGGILIIINILNRWIETAYPLFPFWVTPLLSAVIAVAAGVIVWRRLRESDLLKYEFVTTASHKFRTPLTHIKWAVENLAESPLSESQRTQLQDIKENSARMVELTNLLVDVSETEKINYELNFTVADLTPLAEEVLAALKEKALAKRVEPVAYLQPHLTAKIDATRIKFVIRMILENAVIYTPAGGTVTLSLYRHGNQVVCSVHDTGIGLSRSELGLIFSKFYRGAQAKLADTEGMGIALFIAKQIIARHGGKIWAESAGTGQGSTFAFSLPAEEAGRPAIELRG